MKLKQILALSIAFLSINCAFSAENNTLYAYSTIDALLTGAYDGNLSIGELKKQGNFGLGTYNNLDGEMILLDGRFYHAHADGKVTIDYDNVKTPLAYVTTFNDNTSNHLDSLHHLNTLAQIETTIDSQIDSKNYFYAIRITGLFNQVVTRAIAPQDKPYKPLAELVKTQSVFTSEQIEGTLVGIRSPGFSKGFSVVGYHWHFISKNEEFGGHVLKADLLAGSAKIQTITKIKLDMPDSEEFQHADQLQDRTTDLHSVETIRK